MPGAYTHITMANLASERITLEELQMPLEAIVACGKWLKYCELGSVSPDLPYLQFTSSDAKAWADTMHYKATDGVIRSVIGQLRAGSLTQDEKERGLAWLLGYTAHVVMDCTLHPVVNLKVGDYSTHAKEHRICEMNQDLYIFRRLNLEIGPSNHLDEGVKACRRNGQLDPAIVGLWTKALQETHGEAFAANVPKPSEWHWWFGNAVDTADSGDVFRAVARHVAPGLIYPTTVDEDFIKDLRTPKEVPMHFDVLFDQAKQNVLRVWKTVARGALGLDQEYQTVLEHCDLDTGLTADGRMIYWQGA